LLVQLKRPEEALALLKELEKSKDYLTPEVACVNQGKLVIDCYRDYQKAHEHFLHALALAPSYVDAHYYAALTAYQLKDLPCAKNEVKTILFLEPDHQGARALAGMLGFETSSAQPEE
jgi:tetratricopeptide (TPR) repeat protein